MQARVRMGSFVVRWTRSAVCSAAREAQPASEGFFEVTRAFFVYFVASSSAPLASLRIARAFVQQIDARGTSSYALPWFEVCGTAQCKC